MRHGRHTRGSRKADGRSDALREPAGAEDFDHRLDDGGGTPLFQGTEHAHEDGVRLRSPPGLRGPFPNSVVAPEHQKARLLQQQLSLLRRRRTNVDRIQLGEHWSRETICDFAQPAVPTSAETVEVAADCIASDVRRSVDVDAPGSAVGN